MTKKYFLVYLEKDSIGSLFLLCNLFGNDGNRSSKSPLQLLDLRSTRWEELSQVQILQEIEDLPAIWR